MIGLAIATLSFETAVEVTVEVQDNVYVLAVNEKNDTKRGGLFSSTKNLTLPNGVNQIVFATTHILKMAASMRRSEVQ